MLYNSGAAPSGYGQQDTGAGPLDGWLGIGSAARQPQASLLQHMDRRSGAPGPQPVRLSAPSGVGGLLAREQQKAAAADRYAAVSGHHESTPAAPAGVVAHTVQLKLQASTYSAIPAGRVLDTALQDLQGLMQQAHKMVELAEQLRQALARAATDTASEEVGAAALHRLPDQPYHLSVSILKLPADVHLTLSNAWQQQGCCYQAQRWYQQRSRPAWQPPCTCCPRCIEP